MGRHKKVDVVSGDDLEFDTLFGSFRSPTVEDEEPMFKIETIGEEYAEPCRECGDQPSVHVANFSDKMKYRDNVYICCSHCSACDGKWYPDKKSAIDEWNRRNAGSAPRDRSKKDGYDFIKEIMDDVKVEI